MESRLAEIKTGLHGFSDLVSFLKATISLGVTIAGILYVALTWALDERYAPMAVTGKVEANGAIAASVDTRLVSLSASVKGIKQDQLLDQIFETKLKSCESNPEQRPYFEQRLQNLRQKYSEYSTAPPYVPNCSDVQ